MQFFEILKAFLIGIVQGITEWLPVSSTGHMILFHSFLKLDVSEAFWNMFLVVIQLGSILAVLVLFWQRLNPFSSKKTTQERKQILSLWLHVILAIIPSGIVGVLFDDWFDAHLHRAVPVAIALIVYGVIFLFLERLPKHRGEEIASADAVSYRTAFLIGLFQILSLIPGTSRSGSTIIGGLVLGCSRTVAAEFTFYLAVPVMVGASGLRLVKYFLKGNAFAPQETAVLLVGCAVAFAVSIVVIRFLMGFIKKHDFKPFGWYRIALGLVVLAFFLVRG
jgi:undecaprenyl-diphosphatase